jgi:hypothetical protein
VKVVTAPLSARNIHLTAMSIAGLALGVAVVTRPTFGRGVMFPFFLLILVSLAADVGIAVLATRRPVTPLSMNARMAGFLSGAILYLLVTWLFATGVRHV